MRITENASDSIHPAIYGDIIVWQDDRHGAWDIFAHDLREGPPVNATPTPRPTPAATPTPFPTRSPTPGPTPGPTPARTPSPTPGMTPGPSPSPG
ncbi:MAG: hypothetical protein KO206_09000 [Methanomicrobiaceae archaeon]|nr:hypothetical protein [Methanomicrobiaceae archaeon]